MFSTALLAATSLGTLVLLCLPVTEFPSVSSSHPSPSWNFSVDLILASARNLLAQAVQFNDYIASVEAPTVANVLLRLIEHEHHMLLLQNQLIFLQHVSADKNIRNASTEAQRLLEQTAIEQETRAEVYHVYKKLHLQVVASEEKLEPELRKFLDMTVQAYELNGLDLAPDHQRRVMAVQLELSQLLSECSKNNNEERGFIAFTKAQLDGVPEAILEQYERDRGANGTVYRVTFKSPGILPVLKYAKNLHTRKAAHMASSRLVPQNANLIAKIVATRYRMARELGYRSFSDYVLEECMAKSPENVLRFLTNLKDKLQPLASAERATLLELKNADLAARGLAAQHEYYAWDHPFYDNMLLEQRYKVDHHKISEYFPLGQTIKKMLGFYETLFDVKFVEQSVPEPASVWHPDVQKFSVHQNISFGQPKNEFMGWILFDLHPREGKYLHAGSFMLDHSHTRHDGTRHPACAAIVCNFGKPNQTKPALLTHEEVLTFFHELGHAMHTLLSRTKLARFLGTNVPRDFVECPSQMLEYWTWSNKELRALSSHYKTGEPIPDSLIDLLVASKKANMGLYNSQQLHLALFDMALHTISDDHELHELDIEALWNRLAEEVAMLSHGGQQDIGYSKVTHLVNGYESGYYSYLYSQVFATDIFYTHFKDNPMSVEHGLRYRDTILKNGGALEIMDILLELLGRPPNHEAFMTDILGQTF